MCHVGFLLPITSVVIVKVAAGPCPTTPSTSENAATVNEYVVLGSSPVIRDRTIPKFSYPDDHGDS